MAEIGVLWTSEEDNHCLDGKTIVPGKYPFIYGALFFVSRIHTHQ